MITLRQYEAGEIILHENDTGETAYVIERGRVEVSKELDGQKVHLAYMGAGEIFGEMSVIDDMPRSATVTAVEKTAAHEIQRELLFRGLQTDPEVAVNILKALFERLREANATILHLQKVGSQPLSPLPSAKAHVIVCLEGLTPKAALGLPTNPLQIEKFPFRIGRLSPDPLVHNDLMIPDSVPLQISRHHVEFIKHEGRIGVLDRGSTLGSLVDSRQIGGSEGDPGPLFFSGSEGTLVLGNRDSPFRYKVAIRTEE